MVEEKPVDIRAHELEIIDWRAEVGRLDSLSKEVLVWAEGTDKAKGKSRYELYPAKELAIYTTPASLTDLRAALEIVKPRTIYVFAVAPNSGNSGSMHALPRQTEEFLTRLAGLAKYSINNKDGKFSIQELASVMAQRERAIRNGLEWLAAGGHVTINVEADMETVLLSAGKGETNPYVQKELYTAVRGILEETAAYRQYFARANLESIIRAALA